MRTRKHTKLALALLGNSECRVVRGVFAERRAKLRRVTFTHALYDDLKACRCLTRLVCGKRQIFREGPHVVDRRLQSIERFMRTDRSYAEMHGPINVHCPRCSERVLTHIAANPAIQAS